MIVTCPNCTARYKIPEAKIKGRGAKITCPNCAHKFVVYREGEEGIPGATPAPVESTAVPRDIARRDFRTVGVIWKVRKGIGLTYDFHDLKTLREYLDEGQIDENDVLSFDAKDWRPIKQITDLDHYFWNVWQRALAGEIASPPEKVQEHEDESDAPTTIVGHGTSLADEIRRAVHDAKTPAPAAERGPRAAPAPAPHHPPHHSQPRTPTPPLRAAHATITPTTEASASVPVLDEEGQLEPTPPPAKEPMARRGGGAPSQQRHLSAPQAPEPKPDPFANLGNKKQPEEGGSGLRTLAFVIVALMILLVPAAYLVFTWFGSAS